jgi:hypothetical protein
MARGNSHFWGESQPEPEGAVQGNQGGINQKIDLKLIQVPIFDGKTPDDAIDAGT